MNVAVDKVQLVPLDKSANYSLRNGEFPTDIAIWTGDVTQLSEDASHYIVVYSGEAAVEQDGYTNILRAGHYGVFSGEAEVLSGDGSALIVSAIGHHAMPLFGGPIEETGRLRYIDNCRNTVLLPPSVKGEPCLNFLDLCAGVTQTAHTHPSLRVGIVLRGNGACGTADGTLPLTTGTMFVIPPGTSHSFQSQGEPMKIVIYHPDSADGPTHVNNTMLNNTFVDGRTAQNLPELHTREERPV